MSASHPRGMLRCPALLCALAMALLFPIAGCARATPTPQPVSISFAHPQEDADAYRQLLQVFNFFQWCGFKFGESLKEVISKRNDT